MQISLQLLRSQNSLITLKSGQINHVSPVAIFNQWALINYLVYKIMTKNKHFPNSFLPKHFNNTTVYVKSKLGNQRIADQQRAFLFYGIYDGNKAKHADFEKNIFL